MPFSPIAEILADLKAGKMIVLTDDERRENEGDLVMAAEHVTPEAVTFMLSVARGYLCLSLTEDDCDRLDLHPQAAVNTTMRGTAFTVSIDGHPKHGFTTGVSARERAKCIQMCIDPRFTVDDFTRPGHINPLRSRTGGVLVRTGQTEGSLDLCRLAGLYPAATIIEIMRDDGEMARVPDLEKICARHNLKMCSVAQIIEHRLARESLVRRLPPAEGTMVQTPEGPFRLLAFESVVDPQPHVVLTLGDVGRLDAREQPLERVEPTLVRMHRRNLLSDVFGATVGESAPTHGTADDMTGHDTLRAAMRAVQREGHGAIVYLRPEGVGATLDQRLSTIRRTAAHDPGSDVPDLARPGAHGQGAVPGGLPAHMRDLGIGCQILRHLGLSRLRLLSNHAAELPPLDAFGLEVVERVGLDGVGSTSAVVKAGRV